MTTDANSDALTLRRRQLRFRSWHRGTREADLLLGSFADAHLDRFSTEEMDAFEALLEASDPDLYIWITGREAVPVTLQSPVMDLLRQHRIPPSIGA